MSDIILVDRFVGWTFCDGCYGTSVAIGQVLDMFFQLRFHLFHSIFDILEM